MEPVNRTGWAQGAHNRSKARTTPKGYVRESVNFVATPEGTLRSRPSIARVVEGTNVTAAAEWRGRVLYADGSRLMTMGDNGPKQVAALSAVATALAPIGDGIYVATPDGGRYVWRGNELPWAPRAPLFSLSVESGGLSAGKYKVAVTSRDQSGRTSGAAPLFIDVPEGGAIRVTGVGSVYISAPNGQAMYYQGGSGSSYLCSRVYDDEERITTEGLLPLPASPVLVPHNALLVAVVGAQLWVGEPFAPYLCDMSRGFFSFPEAVTNCISCGNGVFVTADKSYYLAGVESATPELREVYMEGGVAGTATELPDGSVAWFSRRGLVVGNSDGTVRLVTDAQYAPRVAAMGASGYTDANGVPAVITTMRGVGAENVAAARDFHDLEIIRDV